MEEGCCKQMHERHIEFAYRNRRMVAVFIHETRCMVAAFTPFGSDEGAGPLTEMGRPTGRAGVAPVLPWSSCIAGAPDARRKLRTWGFRATDRPSAQREPCEPCVGGPLRISLYKPRLGTRREPKPAPLICQRHQPKH